MVTISESEQEFYKSRTSSDGRPLTIPKRCKECRIKKKARYAQKERIDNSPFAGIYHQMVDGKTDKELL